MEELRTDIVTATLESPHYDYQTESKRLNLLKSIVEAYPSSSVILLPAGFFHYEDSDGVIKIAKNVSDFLSSKDSSITVCFGIDCDESISKNDKK